MHQKLEKFQAKEGHVRHALTGSGPKLSEYVRPAPRVELHLRRHPPKLFLLCREEYHEMATGPTTQASFIVQLSPLFLLS